MNPGYLDLQANSATDSLCDLGHDLSGPRFPYRPVLQGLCITMFKELEAKSALTTVLPWLPSTDTISPLGGALQKDED